MLPTEPLPAALADAARGGRGRASAGTSPTVAYAASVPSTMDWAAALADAGGPHGLVVVAGHQTAGRGRRGRRWHSPAHAGLYFSTVVRPPVGRRGRRRAEPLRAAHAGRRRGRRRGDRPGDRARGVAEVAQRSLLRPQAGRRAGRGPRPRTAGAVRGDRRRHQRARREVPGRRRGPQRVARARAGSRARRRPASPPRCSPPGPSAIRTCWSGASPGSSIAGGCGPRGWSDARWPGPTPPASTRARPPASTRPARCWSTPASGVVRITSGPVQWQ